MNGPARRQVSLAYILVAYLLKGEEKNGFNKLSLFA